MLDFFFPRRRAPDKTLKRLIAEPFVAGIAMGILTKIVLNFMPEHPTNPEYYSSENTVVVAVAVAMLSFVNTLYNNLGDIRRHTRYRRSYEAVPECDDMQNRPNNNTEPLRKLDPLPRDSSLRFRV